MTEPINPFENSDNIISSTKGELSEKKLLFTIWLKPKQTFTYILKYCPDKFVILFFVLGGIGRAIDRAVNRNMGDELSLGVILAIAIIGGALFGWISYYFYAWLLKVSGKWLKGEASTNKYRTVLAWSIVPQVLSLLLVVPQILLFGNGFFSSEFEEPSLALGISLLIFGLIDIALGIWSLVILVNGIMVIQNFGAGKAFLNAILPVFMILLPILLLVLMFMPS